jgi:hypothetical protein
MSSLIKLTCKWTLRQVFVCMLIHTGKGVGAEGGEEMNHREGLRGNSLQSWVELKNSNMTECILQSINDKHLPQSPCTGTFFWMTTFNFSVYIVNAYMY